MQNQAEIQTPTFSSDRSCRALVAMSGGVDSAVAAYLMQQQGYACTGATMRLFPGSSSQEAQDARAVSETLGMKHIVLDYTALFAQTVIDRFVHDYEMGRTPNPCIVCNRFLKFGALHAAAAQAGCEMVATGHYARVEQDKQSGRYLLKKARDEAKDQSYVLYTLSQTQLSHTCFPLGALTKAEVRALAQANGFSNANKRESQDICFVPDGDYVAFIQRYTGKTYLPGPFVDQTGKVLGTHNGVIRYTVGQRRGLGLSAEEPWYVKGIDVAANAVILCHAPELFSRFCELEDINLISRTQIDAPLRVMAKVRYRQPAQPATVIQTDTDRLQITFDAPQRAITPGQAAVLYEGDTVVGGGTICPLS